MFISFEGIEGCGKSTQIRLLATKLESAGKQVQLTREPGGCKISDKIRALLLDADNQNMAAMTELMLYGASRAQHVSQLIHPALAEGRIVLCDRFSDATRAYQCFGRGLDRKTIEIINGLACNQLVPELTILLDCPVELGLSRARQRIEAGSGPREERFELESLQFHQKVRNGYLTLAEEEPDRFLIVDASGDVKQVAEQIWDKAAERILA